MSKLIVHQIPGGWGLPSVGPFSLKLETWLRMVDIPYQAVADATPFKGPKRKLPWIEHEGRQIGDSGFIIEYLQGRFGCDPDAQLAPPERAVAHSLRRLVEESLYWAMVYDRWVVDQNWPATREVVLGLIPSPMRAIVGPMARRDVRRQLDSQGTGRHTREEIHAIGAKDVGALADWLSEKPFLMGERPTGIDAVAYGLLANIMLVPVASPIKDAALGHGNLVDYVSRMRQRYFG